MHPEIIAFVCFGFGGSGPAAAPPQNFASGRKPSKGDKPHELQVRGGRSVAAGGRSRRRPEGRRSQLSRAGPRQAPIWIGELGWWHYLNGDYQKAVELLSEAAQQRPGDLNLWLRLAWAQIEIRRYGDALQTLNGAVYEQKMPARSGRSCERWRTGRHRSMTRRCSEFDDRAVRAQPEWENSSWVKALYSPLVAQSTEEMQAERERRKQKARAAASR